jgi:hypothetical protein
LLSYLGIQEFELIEIVGIVNVFDFRGCTKLCTNVKLKKRSKKEEITNVISILKN